MSRFLILVLLVLPCGLMAQDVEGFFSDISRRLAAREYLKVTGRFGADASLNAFGGYGVTPRRQAPFTFGLNAGLNFDILGIQAPFTAAFSSRNATYNLPSYAFYGLSPSYRWITLHGGDRSMTFSPYSLSGINYRGAGIELRPGKFRFAAMTGRLRRARIQDAGSIQDIEAALRRRGSGFQLGYSPGEGSEIKLSFFNSNDELQPAAEQDSLPFLRPERNQVITLGGRQQLSDFLRFEFEIAQSVLTRDQRVQPLPNPSGRITQFGLFQPNLTTTAARAAKFDIGLSPKFGDLRFGYERIDPEYRTHGSLYFQSDLENFTAGVTAPLFSNKLNLTANAGYQRNDLDGRKASNLNRLIASVNASVAVSDRTSVGLGFSNFNSTSRYKAIALNSPLADSVVLAQTQLSADVNASFVIDQSASQLILVAGNWQRASLLRDETVDTSALSTFAMAMVNYTYQPAEGNGSLTGGIILHRNVTSGLRATTLGPSASYGRKILKEKGSLRAGASYSLIWTDREPPGGGTLQVSIGGGYALSKQQTLNVNSTLLAVAAGSGRTAYTDLRLSVSYGFTFQ